MIANWNNGSWMTGTSTSDTGAYYINPTVVMYPPIRKFKPKEEKMKDEYERKLKQGDWVVARDSIGQFTGEVTKAGNLRILGWNPVTKKYNDKLHVAIITYNHNFIIVDKPRDVDIERVRRTD